MSYLLPLLIWGAHQNRTAPRHRFPRPAVTHRLPPARQRTATQASTAAPRRRDPPTPSTGDHDYHQRVLHEERREANNMDGCSPRIALRQSLFMGDGGLEDPTSSSLRAPAPFCPRRTGEETWWRGEAHRVELVLRTATEIWTHGGGTDSAAAGGSTHGESTAKVPICATAMVNLAPSLVDDADRIARRQRRRASRPTREERDKMHRRQRGLDEARGELGRINF